ncbi:MAG: RNA methyltransferase [Eggerthellaceae bacterium]|nr:RNA methyltransferase [Eggerthellaceae bacterium]
MGIVRIDTLEDERLDPYARLTDVQLRSRIEPARAVFIAESAEVVSRALDAGMEPLSLMTCEHHLPMIANVLERLEVLAPEAPVFILPEEALRKLTGFELTRGTLAAFRRPPERSVEDVAKDARLVAVLEDIRNHTNVGAAFRSAAALGADAILVTPACYDPLYRRAIRVSMGTVFQVPWARIGTDPHDWAAEGIPLLHELGFTTVAMALRDDAVSLDDPRLKERGRLALVFGTEGDGLASSTIARCDYTVRIPMAHGVDSLNVAASTAVAFWEFRNLGNNS